MTASSQPSAAREGVLVIGAGELGSSVLAALSRRRNREPDLRSLALAIRRPTTDQSRQRADELVAKAVDLVEIDVAEASIPELAGVMSRYHTVVSCIGMAAGPGTHCKLAEAALAASVPRYLPWQFGVDYDVIGRNSPQDLFDEQLDVRELLRGQDATKWVIVSTGMFTSFLFEPAFGVVHLAANTVNALGKWDNEITLTTPDDIGTMTAEIIHARPRIVDQVVFVAGDTISFRQLADILDDARGVPVGRNEWSLPQLLGELKRDPTDPMKKYRAVFAAGKGVAWPKDASFNAAHGIKTTTTAEWAHAHLGD